MEVYCLKHQQPKNKFWDVPHWFPLNMVMKSRYCRLIIIYSSILKPIWKTWDKNSKIWFILLQNGSIYLSAHQPAHFTPGRFIIWLRTWSSRFNKVESLPWNSAFDRVWHAGLHKVKSSGVSGQIFGLISPFLSNWRLRVVPPEVFYKKMCS